MKVFVTGLGVVSALGVGVNANFKALQKSITGIGLNTLLKGLTEPTYVGELDLSNQDMKRMLGFSKNDGIPRTALLGMLAAKEALGNTILNGERSGFISGTTVGGMDLTEDYFKEAFDNEDHKKVLSIKTHDLGTVTNFIANFCGNPNYVNTISTACSSSANSILLGARMIRAGLLDKVLVGGADALSRFTIHGFRSLMIYDNQPCKPFDAARNGLNLGEGAGYILLENDTSISQTKNNIYAELSGWNNANDAFHQTGTSPNGDGALKAMKGALNAASLNPTDIDYINAHGTATKNNDSSELNALAILFKKQQIAFSSTKSYTGHTLGASGGIEAVFSILSLKNKCVFPILNWLNLMEQKFKQPVTTYQVNVKINNVMSNSFGFGGNSTSLIFSKV